MGNANGFGDSLLGHLHRNLMIQLVRRETSQVCEYSVLNRQIFSTQSIAITRVLRAQSIDKENQPFPVEKVNSVQSELKNQDTSAFHSQRQPKLMRPLQIRRHLTRLIPKLARLSTV